MLDKTQTNFINGIDLDALNDTVSAINEDASRALVEFRVQTEWAGQTRSESTVESYTIGGDRVERRFTVDADEPYELLGTNSAPNPQELLMSALNACMVVGYVAQAAVRGITLATCRIETKGQLDLRGFLGLSDTVPPGYREVDYCVTLKGNGTRDQYDEVHAAVQATSPNFFNFNSRIKMNGTLA